MPPESDPHFKASFAALQSRHGASAPSFATMRAHAQRDASAGLPGPKRPRTAPWVGWVVAGASLAIIGVWWVDRPAPIPPRTHPVASAQRVERLLASIEQQLVLNAALAPAEFLTDVLLTQNQTEPLP
jgi:hypothetical protein